MNVFERVHFLIKGTRKRHLFCQNGILKNKKLNLRAEPPRNVCEDLQHQNAGREAVWVPPRETFFFCF